MAHLTLFAAGSNFCNLMSLLHLFPELLLQLLLSQFPLVRGIKFNSWGIGISAPTPGKDKTGVQ